MTANGISLQLPVWVSGGKLLLPRNPIIYHPVPTAFHHSLRKMLLGHPLVRVVFSALLPAIVLPAHIYVLWRFWQSYSRYVDKRYCSCSCWDTVYKGPYESGVASYKHMYFNATKNSIKMWILVVSGVVALYECTKYLITLLAKRKLRFDMALLFISSIFSHYYAWWAYLNYYNDDYYSQWNHQFFFTVGGQEEIESDQDIIR